MADKWPLANGNWSNAANWNDGTKPATNDVVYADGRTIAIDEDITVAALRGNQRAGGTALGTFTCSGIRTIYADIYGTNSATTTIVLTVAAGCVHYGNVFASTSGTSTTNPALEISARGVSYGNSTGGAATATRVQTLALLVGNATGSTSSTNATVNVLGMMVGNAYGGSTGSSGCVSIGTNGMLIGDTFGGSAASAHGARTSSTGGTHIGNSTGGSNATAYGTWLNSEGVQIGNVTGGTAGPGTLTNGNSIVIARVATGNTVGVPGLSAGSTIVSIETEVGSTPKTLNGSAHLLPFYVLPSVSSGSGSIKHPLFQQVIA